MKNMTLQDATTIEKKSLQDIQRESGFTYAEAYRLKLRAKRKIDRFLRKPKEKK